MAKEKEKLNKRTHDTILSMKLLTISGFFNIFKKETESGNPGGLTCPPLDKVQ